MATIEKAVQIPKCFWKNVADDDEIKLKRKINTPALDEHCSCYGCTGFRVMCDNYAVMEKVNKEELLKQMTRHYPDYGVFSSLGVEE